MVIDESKQVIVVGDGGACTLAQVRKLLEREGFDVQHEIFDPHPTAIKLFATPIESLEYSPVTRAPQKEAWKSRRGRSRNPIPNLPFGHR